MKLYLISGLAADERMFERLHFPQHITPVFLPWRLPASPTETLQQYVHRFAERLNPNEPFALMGLSFGGMVCCELNKILKPQKTVIISSVSTYRQFPPLFWWAKKLHFDHPRLVKGSKKFSSGFHNYFFGAASPAAKALLAQTIKQADEDLLAWSVKQALAWRFDTAIPNLVHLHGSRDKIFPLRYLQPHKIISGGGHLSVFENAPEVSKHLQTIFGA